MDVVGSACPFVILLGLKGFFFFPSNFFLPSFL
uniref:Uncharacterized protein n=1 Tax=Nelumbo nucifera TaxID=4432 RepID=A0A822Z2X9_NELNU|nr:TPA_asm: hypothetical protein HUJ06_007977 [Nelumbo nucifera]